MQKFYDRIISYEAQGEVYLRQTKSTIVEFINGVASSIESSDDVKIDVKISTDTGVGSGITTDINDVDVVDRAYENLKYIKSEPIELYNEKIAENIKYDEKIENLTAKELKSAGEKIYKRLLEKNGESLDAKIMISAKLVSDHVKNTKGFNGKSTYGNYDIMITTKSDEGFDEVYFHKADGKYFELDEKTIDGIIEKHKLRNNQVKIESGKYDVVFSNQAQGVVISRLISGVSDDNIKRNISPLAGKEGEKIFSEKLTVFDDATMDYGYNTRAFDDKCKTSENVLLVENGVFKDTLKNVLRGNFIAREFDHTPQVNASNFIVKPTCTDEELMSSVKRGIMIDVVIGGHIGNIERGDYVATCSSAYLIEDGKLVSKVKDCMVTGNIYEDLKNVKAVGNIMNTLKVLMVPLGYSPMMLVGGVELISK